MNFRCHSLSTLASYSASEPTNCYAAIIKYLAHLWRKSRRRTLKWYRKRYNAHRTSIDTTFAISQVTHTIALSSKRLHKQSRKSRQNIIKNNTNVSTNEFESETFRKKGPKQKRCDKTCPPPPSPTDVSQCLVIEAPRASPEVSDIDLSYSPAKKSNTYTELRFATSKENINKTCIKSSNKYYSKEESKEKPVIHQTNSEIQAIDSTKKESSDYPLKSLHLTAPKHGRHCSAPTLLFLRPTPSPTFVTIKGELHSITETLGSNSETGNLSTSDYSWDEEEAQNDDECKKQSKCFSFWKTVRSGLKILVNHNYFKRAIFLAILFNTLSMGIEYHNQPESLTQAVEISNVIFTGIQTLHLCYISLNVMFIFVVCFAIIVIILAILMFFFQKLYLAVKWFSN